MNEQTALEPFGFREAGVSPDKLMNDKSCRGQTSVTIDSAVE